MKKYLKDIGLCEQLAHTSCSDCVVGKEICKHCTDLCTRCKVFDCSCSVAETCKECDNKYTYSLSVNKVAIEIEYLAGYSYDDVSEYLSQCDIITNFRRT